MNNQINAEEMQEICNPLGIDSSDITYIDQEILPFNKLPVKINALLGEELGRNESFSVVLLDESAAADKDIELDERIAQYIDRKVTKHLTKLQMQNQGIDEETIRRKTEELESRYSIEDILNFKSGAEMVANSVVHYAKFAPEVDFKNKKNQGFKHMLISGREVVFNGLENGRLTKRVVNPLHFFSVKSPETEYFEDGDIAGETLVYTTSALLREFGSELTPKEIETLKDTTSKKHKAKKDMEYYREDSFGVKHAYWTGSSYLDDHTGSHGNTSRQNFMEEELHWVTKMTWKWERKVGFLAMYDEFGEELDFITVDDTFKIPKEKEIVSYYNQWGKRAKKYVWYEMDEMGFETRYELEWIWVPRVWQGTRINNDMFVNISEVPFNPISINNPWKVKLPYHGKDVDAMNAVPTSPVARMKPFQYLYFVVANQLLKLIARNYGSLVRIDTSQLDPRLGDGDLDLALQSTLAYMREGVIFFNSMKDAETGGDFNSYVRPANEVVSYSNTSDLLNMSNLLQFLDNEIGMGFGISPQRLAQFSSNTNVSDNQQAISQSVNTTQPYYYAHNEVWKRSTEYFVNSFILWAKDLFRRYPERDTLKQHYMLPNGSSQVLSLTRDDLELNDIGLFITNYGNAASYIDKMEQLALTFVQNDRATLQDISLIIKSKIDGSSPEEIHSQIVKIQNKNTERENQAQDAQREMAQAQAQHQKEITFQLEELKNEHELQQIVEKGNQDRMTEANKSSNNSSND